MRKFCLFPVLLLFPFTMPAQTIRTLEWYMAQAVENSPLLHDYRNRAALQNIELERLRAVNVRSRVEVAGNILFVPVITTRNGAAHFDLNYTGSDSYYGYDLGESSSRLHAGVTWTKPLLGRNIYKIEAENVRISSLIADNDLRMERHRLERAVTEQYVLCMLDNKQIMFAHTADSMINVQRNITQRLAAVGLVRHSDLRLLDIEREANHERLITAETSLHSHLAELNVLCGVSDTAHVILQDAAIVFSKPHNEISWFDEKFRLDSISEQAALRAFDVHYKPRLDLYADGGVRSGFFSHAYRDFGWSAGITFTWLLPDGKLKNLQRKTVQNRLSTIAFYRANALAANNTRRLECLREVDDCDRRKFTLERRIEEYKAVLDDYCREVAAGQMPILDFITVLRSEFQAQHELILLQTNRLLLVAAYNYWNR